MKTTATSTLKQLLLIAALATCAAYVQAEQLTVGVSTGKWAIPASSWYLLDDLTIEERDFYALYLHEDMTLAHLACASTGSATAWEFDEFRTHRRFNFDGWQKSVRCQQTNDPASKQDLLSIITPVSCPNGFVRVSSIYPSQGCKREIEKIDPLKTPGPTCPTAGTNPINIATGNKFQSETDYTGAGPMPLHFQRYYNSQQAGFGNLGAGWRSNFDRFIETLPAIGFHTRKVHRSDGRAYYFAWSNGVWNSDADVTDTLTQISGGWQYTTADNTVETYNAAGKIVSITNREGLTQTLTYDVDGKLESVTGPFGRSLSFSYDTQGRIDTLTDPAGDIYAYSYDSNNNLIEVTYPDNTPANSTDNLSRRYFYEDVNFPHALTGIRDENGSRFATWTYDAQGRATSSEHAGGAENVTLTYNADGTTTATDVLGESRFYRFEILHGMPKVVQTDGGPCAGCGGLSESKTYDANGFLSSKTDFNDNVTTYVYNARGLQESRTEAVGTPDERTITTVWHSDFRVPTLITELDKTTTYTYTPNGLLESRTETDIATGDSRAVSYTYTAEGLLETVDGPRTDVTDVMTYTYDPAGNLVSTINALGDETKVTAHDPHGRPLAVEDSNGLVTVLTYDARGRLKTRDVGGRVTAFDYDGVGNVKRITLPDASYLDYTYDAAQRLAQVTDSLGNSIKYTLDALGNRTQEDVYDATGTLTRIMRRTYNTLIRLIEETGGAGQLTTYGYDDEGNRTSVTDPNGYATIYAFDALNRLIRTTEPAPASTVTQYTYDGQDNLTTVTDPKGLTTTYTYDGLGNLRELQSPDTGRTIYTYDAAGNRLSQTDAQGVETRYVYDALNRLIAREVPTLTKHVTYDYDLGPHGIGRLARLTDESGTTEYSYDIRGNLILETKTLGGVVYTTGYDYDVADRLSTMTYPSGTVVTYHRDALGRVESVTATVDGITTTLASGIEYLPFGPMKSLTYGNGIAMNRDFDLDYRLTGLTTGSVLDIGYTLDPTGNIEAMDDRLDLSRSQTFDYDPLNRLTAATGVYGTRGYAYDEVGNRTEHTVDGVTDVYTYAPDSHRLLDIAGPGATTFDYDANGNTLTKAGDEYLYDETNRLSEVLANGQLIASYVYNGKGERVTKTVGLDTTVFHYDLSGNLIAETDATGTILREYVYLEGLRLAVLEPSAVTGSGAPIEVDDPEAATVAVGQWTHSSVVSGYAGSGYHYHAPNGVPVGGTVIDNGGAGFSVTGTWPTSTAVTGYHGSHYQHHAKNGASPDGQVIDNDDEATSTVGTWKGSTSVSGFTGSNYQFHAAGSGANRFTWILNPASAGDYRVYARWAAHANRASNATYTVQHAGGSTPVTVNQKQNGGQWRLLGTFTLDAGSGQVVLTDEADGYVIADGIKVEPINAAPNTTTWTHTLGQGGDYDVYTRWTAHPNRASNATYTIHHQGGSTPVTVNQRQNGGAWNRLGTFTFTTGSATITLTDEADGYVIADAVQFVPVGAAPNRFTWHAALPHTGSYEVYARWTAHPNRATDAQYTVHHAGGSDTVTVNQKLNGGQWHLLGSFAFGAGTASVELTDQANGYVIADAVQWVPLETATTGSASIYYLHTDHLDTPRAVTDETQAVVWQADYTPFGDAQVTVNALESNLRFPGQYFDEETGLHYNYFRDYDPGTGRYIESDPIGLNGGLNTYAYVAGNPLRFIDPKGLEILVCTRKAKDILGQLDANHGYLWDTRTDKSCGAHGSSGFNTDGPQEAGPTVDQCRLVPGSAGNEDKVMSCCGQKGLTAFFPFLNDCQSRQTDCLKENGLASPGFPGGRVGRPCDPCEPPPETDPPPPVVY